METTDIKKFQNRTKNSIRLFVCRQLTFIIDQCHDLCSSSPISWL